jgi:predicted DNA-binding protein (MmcQ/YjbR family)
MTLSRLRELCLALPGATEQIQWGTDLVFKVGGRMFCVAATESARVVASFKCDDETFTELCERDGIIPAPYLARARWVALERWDALENAEFAPLLERACLLIRARLPGKARQAIDGASKPRARSRPTSRSRKA